MRAAGVRLLIGLDAELAETVRADGLHLPEHATHRAPDIRARRPDWLLTDARFTEEARRHWPAECVHIYGAPRLEKIAAFGLPSLSLRKISPAIAS